MNIRLNEYPSISKVITILRLVGIAATLGMMLSSQMVKAANTSTSFSLNVKEPPYNAVGNATTVAIQNGTAVNDTYAFQSALNDAWEQGGGIVYVPTGDYLLSNIQIPAHVTLQGIFIAPPAYAQGQGSTLMAIEGRGSDDGTPFITLSGHNSTIKGFAIFYPEQNDPAAVKQYPWTIRGGEAGAPHFVDNLTVQDLLLKFFIDQTFCFAVLADHQW